VNGDLGRRFEVEQGVVETRVAHIHLGRLALSLGEVLKPGRQHPNHIGALQNIEVVLCSLLVHAQRTRQLRQVQDLAVIVGNHGPEPAERLGGYPNAELREVSLQKGSNEGFSSPEARLVGGGKEGPWEPPAQPELVKCLRTHLPKREPTHLHEQAPPGQ